MASTKMDDAFERMDEASAKMDDTIACVVDDDDQSPQEAFVEACLDGDLELAKRLKDSDETIDVYEVTDEVFYQICDGEHVAVIQWLCSLEKYYFACMLRLDERIDSRISANHTNKAYKWLREFMKESIFQCVDE